MTERRPSRSDEHLAVEEEARMEAEVREYFDDMNPKRHTKPSRSECDYDSLLLNNNNNPSASASASDDSPIPELLKFQDLEAHSQSQKIVCECDGSKPVEEYMATDYYDDLNLMDKQHHTTGSGFIKMEESNTNSSSSSKGIASDANENAWDHERAANSSCRESKIKGNPATNDWIPSAQTQTVNVASNKPKRSDE